MARSSLPLTMLLVLSLACNIGGALTPQKSPTAASALTATPVVSAGPPRPTQTPANLPPLRLDHQPLYWFAPLPRQQPPAYNGSLDYMDLFSPEADWNVASSELQVFKLYGGWAEADSTSAERSQAVAEIRRRGLALAVEAGPLFADSTCGQFIEGFAGEQMLRMLDRLKEAGADLNFIAFDEPYFYAHFYDGDQACKWETNDIAAKVGDFVQKARLVFPDVMVGDTEPLTGAATPEAYKTWLDAFKQVNGYDLAFLHLDIDWADSAWPQEVIQMESLGQQAGVPIGLIYTGNSQDPSDEAWLSIAGERVKAFELKAGGSTDQVIFQSWNDKPDAVLPESNPFTFTGFIKTYFEDRNALGFSADAHAANLALGRPTRTSRALPGNGGDQAVDGDPGTLWSSGNGAPGWIEIDLGQPVDIGSISLLTSQYPAGRTVHLVKGRGPGTGGAFVLLHTFDGTTDDSVQLTATPDKPWTGIQIIRIETTTSPSWVAWREIEITPASP